MRTSNNHTRRDDPRNDLFISTVALAVALGAPTVVIENVPSVTNSHGDVVKIARSLLMSEGYAVTSGVIRLDSVGGWQTRARYFMIAIAKGDQRSLDAALEEWTSAAGKRPAYEKPPLGSLWAVQDLLDVDARSTFDTPPTPGKENMRRINFLFDNEIHDLPNSQRPDCHRDGTTYKSVYGRMLAHDPAPTITTGFGTAGQGRFIHPTRRRMITPHEAARFQSFPDGYGFEGDDDVPRKLLAKWIGDAVPPFLGSIAAGIAISQTLGVDFVPPWA
ncbi:DNA cytosine methyltransferase [Paracoccus sanguinis]|uniref:DNA cytosine methyltransferase n=1 Tax=Paracoccus sanguinis TaxID=1545044 RepID=UPI0022B09BFA|nr:DNA cytosine methyltransferase [Paracoccus sanguinis]